MERTGDLPCFCVHPLQKLRQHLRDRSHLPADVLICISTIYRVSAHRTMMLKKHTLCRVAANPLFIYFKQNSHNHNLPSGTYAYSSGYGAEYHVLISYGPNLIVLIFSNLALPVQGTTSCVVPGVEGNGCASGKVWWSSRSRRGLLVAGNFEEGVVLPLGDAMGRGEPGPGVSLVGTGPPSCFSAAFFAIWYASLSASVIFVRVVSASSPVMTPPYGIFFSSGSSSTGLLGTFSRTIIGVPLPSSESLY